MAVPMELRRRGSYDVTDGSVGKTGCIAWFANQSGPFRHTPPYDVPIGTVLYGPADIQVGPERCSNTIPGALIALEEATHEHVSIHPSQLVIGALQTLRRAGIDATLTPDNVRPAVTAAADLLRALGVPTAATPAATPAAAVPYQVGTPEMWARPDMRPHRIAV
jgi:hypothetical protein